MNRRTFIKFTAVSSVFLSQGELISKTFSKDNLSVLSEVYEILFPKTLKMPSSKEFGALEFLVSNINHQSFDSYDKNLILNGTRDFFNTFPEFLKLSKNEQTKIIGEIINTNDYAQSWLSRLLYYGFEALLSDPIYGGNKNQIGWNSLEHKIGYPRAKTKYGQKI